MKRDQSGTTTVEFAIVGALFFMLIFAITEFGRAMFVANALAEGTRRGARMAAVCPVGDPRPAQVAIAPTGTRPVASNISTGNVEVTYLTTTGAVVTNPTTEYITIRYVRVRIVNYAQQLAIPFVNSSFMSPSFETTLPIESLGYSPTQQAFVPCTAV